MKNVGLYLLLLAGLLSGGYLRGQNSEEGSFLKNHLYPEFIAIGTDYNEFPVSINYERVFSKNRKWSLRVGFWPDFASNFISVPVTFVRISRPYANHHLETALGPAIHFDYYYLKNDDPYGPRRMIYEYYPDLYIGYRYQKPGGRLSIRAVLHVFPGWPTAVSPAISAGYRF
ncbi:MAG: hypothetical protein ACOYXB_05285 [Bacteroidota bacterium]